MRLIASFTTRRHVLALGAALAGASMARGQSRSNTSFVVPFSPGGSADTFVRLLAEECSKLLGATVVVENKPGASAIIGADYVAKSPPDGRTVLFGSNSSLVNNLALFDKLPYDPAKDLIPVALLGEAPMLVVTRNDAPFKTIADVVAYARVNPDKLSRGSAGTGNITHLGPLRFEMQQNIRLTHVPYSGETPSMTALMGGSLDLHLGSAIALRQIISAGKLRALAVMGPHRYEDLPDVPTMREAGYADADAIAWYTFMVPAGTPRDVVLRLNQVLNQVLKSPDTVTRIRKLGIEPTGGTPEQAAQYIEAERSRWIPFLRSAGIKG